MTRRRLTSTIVLAGGLSWFVAVSLLSYQAQIATPAPGSWEGGVAPRPARLDRAAEAALERARSALRSDRPARERYRAYREDSRVAADFLSLALRSAPLSGRRLVRLAELQQELGRPTAEPARDRLVALVELAVAIEPANGRLRLDSADLAFALSRRDLGLDELHQALKLRPELAAEAVEKLSLRGWSDAEMLDAASSSPSLLTALAAGLTDPAMRARWLTAVESLREPPAAELLRAYGRHGREAGRLEPTAMHLESLGPLDPRPDEVERLIQLAACRLESGTLDAALGAARRASAADPADPRPARYLGRVALQVGEPAVALAAFDEALGRAARGARPAAERARLYGWLGAAHDAQGRPDLALGAFRKARRLDPSEPLSMRHLAEGPKR